MGPRACHNGGATGGVVQGDRWGLGLARCADFQTRFNWCHSGRRAMNDADGNSKEPAAHDWAGEAGTCWLAQLARFESMHEPIGAALPARAASVAGGEVVGSGWGGAGRTRRSAEREGNKG